jgi:hypothetical protein
MADPKKDYDAIFKAMKTARTMPSTSAVPKSDIAGQLATGALYDFPTGMVGLPGDVGRLMQTPPSGPIPSPSDVLAKLPSISDVQQFTSRVTGFTPRPYEELDTAEKTARTTGSFIPNILTAPQTTIARNAPALVRGAANVGRRVLNVVAPGVISDVAGQQFEGEALEPVARVAGALLGGRVSSGKPSVSQAAKGSEVPLATLGQQTDQAYKGLRGAGIAYDRNAFIKTLDDSISEIKLSGIGSKNVRETLEELKGIGANELDWTRLDTIRQNLSKTAYGGNTVEADQIAARLALKKINELETSPNFYMKPGANGMSSAEISAQTKEARDLASRRIKTRQIESIIDVAPTYAGTAENNLRSGFRRLLRDIKKKENVGWTNDEISAIQDVADGRQIVQALSKLSPSLRESIPGMSAFGTSLMGSGAAGFAAGGPVGAILGPLGQMSVGVPARIASGKRTEEAARRAANFVSAPRSAQQQAAAATEMARRGVGQRLLMTPAMVAPGLLDEDRR